jgi:hypothetical protein
MTLALLRLARSAGTNLEGCGVDGTPAFTGKMV